MPRISADSRGVRQKLSKRAHQKAQYVMANQALADMNPFVPMREGILRMTGHVKGLGDFVVWNTPYARVQFYTQFENYTTPGTGPRWDNKTKAMYMSDWVKAYMRGAGDRKSTRLN